MAFRFNAINGILDLTGSAAALSGIGIYFNAGTISTTDPAVNGAWLITTSGNNLSFQRREGGVYVEKSAVTP